jgi:hypothetical protein
VLAQRQVDRVRLQARITPLSVEEPAAPTWMNNATSHLSTQRCAKRWPGSNRATGFGFSTTMRTG